MDGELENRAAVIDRHRKELAALVGALNTKTAELHANGISLVLGWEKTGARPQPLVLREMHFRNGSGEYVGRIHSGPTWWAPVAMLVAEINAKVSELTQAGVSATMAIHKITSARDPKGRPVLAVMEIAPRSQVEAMIAREDFGTSVTVENGEVLNVEVPPAPDATLADIEKSLAGRVISNLRKIDETVRG